MGIGKCIEGYSVLDDYTVNTSIFVEDLSEKLNADFILNIYDKDYGLVGEKNHKTSFGKQTNYHLSISYDEYIVNNEKVELPTYELTIPINYVFEDALELTFYPSKAVIFIPLTFEHLWGHFIDTLKFKNPYRPLVFDRYERLRKEYSEILKSLGLKAIFIYTHAYYHIESLNDVEEYQNLSFDDISTIARDKDNLGIFDLEKILYTKSPQELDVEFKYRADLDIAFVDNLQFK